MKYVVLALFLVLLGGCTLSKQPSTPLAPTPTPTVQSSEMKQRVEFQTKDGVMIVGNWYEAPGAKHAALLLHMMPATKESWKELATTLQGKGVSTLAIDMRGHGESAGDQNQPSVTDVDAGVEWLKGKGLQEDGIELVGASIGANLALSYASNHPTIPAIVLLSPGLDYHGIQTEGPMKKLSQGTAVLLLASRGDMYAAQTVEALSAIRPSADTTLVDGSAHGTQILAEHPPVSETVVDFLTKTR